MEQLKGAKFDGGKPRPSTVPVEAILAILETRMYGFEKYGDAEDWRSIEPERWARGAFTSCLRNLGRPDAH